MIDGGWRPGIRVFRVRDLANAIAGKREEEEEKERWGKGNADLIRTRRGSGRN